MPCGIGTGDIQSVLLGYSLGYPGLLRVFSITGPQTACIKAKDKKDRVEIDGIVLFPAAVCFH